MTTEEKAKAYDEALGQARKFHRAFVSGYNYPAADIKASYDAIFPELKESEDDKIKKGLIQYFNKFSLDTFAGLDPKKILAWLEKQGDKPFDYEKDFAPKSAMEAIKVCDNVISVINALEVEEVDWEEKATQLSHKYFPDEENIWARPNIEAHKCKSACIEMVEWLEAQKGGRL